MSVLTEKHMEIITKSEWIAITTSGEEAHVAGTWCDYLVFVNEDEFLIPVGGYVRTGKNLAKDSRVKLLCGTREVKGAHGTPGKGCMITGRAEIRSEGEYADMMKQRFPWCRGAMVVKAEKASAQL